VSLAERPRLRLFTLTLLFFAQGVPWGFFAISLPAYLASRDVDATGLARLGVMSYWPFAFKWLFGPLIDTVTISRLGRRRPWILLAQPTMAVTLGAALAVSNPVKELELLIWLVLAHTVFNAMQNVAVDALAIDLLDESERGRANGLMYGGKYLGGALGGAGMARVMKWWGFHAAIAIQAAILLAIAIVPLLVRERTDPAPPHTPAREIARTLREVFRLRSPALAALLMLLALAAGGMLSVIAPVLFMQGLHWDPADYSVLAGGPSLLIGALGASISGVLADKVGHRRQVAIATIAMGSVWLVFGLGAAWWTRDWFCYPLVALEPFMQGFLVVSLWTLCMDCSVPRTAATQFAAFTSLTNLSSIVGIRVLGAHVLDLVSFRGAYLLAAGFQIALVVVVPVIDPHQVKRELISGAPGSSPRAGPA
jgi:PAT family beta-lactamase induction signal transducer AmpG